MNHLTAEHARRRNDALAALSASRQLLMAHELQMLRTERRRRRKTRTAGGSRVRLLLTAGTAARGSRSMGSTPS